MELKTFEAFASSQSTNEVQGEPISIPMVDQDFIVLLDKKQKKRTIYHFVERNPTKKVIKSKIFGDQIEIVPWVYSYSLENGNVSRGHEKLWARQELRGDSKAFNKGNVNKIAIPNDLEKAAAVIELNYLNHLKKVYADNPIMLDKRIREINDRTGIFDE